MIVVDGWAITNKVVVEYNPYAQFEDRYRVWINDVTVELSRVEALRDGGTRILVLAVGGSIRLSHHDGQLHSDRVPKLNGIDIVCVN